MKVSSLLIPIFLVKIIPLAPGLHKFVNLSSYFGSDQIYAHGANLKIHLSEFIVSLIYYYRRAKSSHLDFISSYLPRCHARSSSFGKQGISGQSHLLSRVPEGHTKATCLTPRQLQVPRVYLSLKQRGFPVVHKFLI